MIELERHKNMHTKLILPILSIPLLFIACKKDKSDCSEEIIISFNNSTYAYTALGLPDSWVETELENSYGGDNSGASTYNDDGLPLKRSSNFDGGYGWNKTTYDWYGDSCHTTFEQEGPFEPSYNYFLINEKRELTKYGNYDYYYNNGQLDSIIGSGNLAKRYLSYESGLLASFQGINSMGELQFKQYFNYDGESRLISETFEAANGDTQTTSYIYSSSGKLREILYREVNSSKPNVTKQAEVQHSGCILPKSMDPLFRIKFVYFGAYPLSF